MARFPSFAVPFLFCPVCRGSLAIVDRNLSASLRCTAGHDFAIARHGYVNLTTASRPAPPGDTAGMVASRARFLAAGYFEPLAERLADIATMLRGDRDLPAASEVGAGTAYYLRRLVERGAISSAVAIDSSKHATRRASRVHPRIAAVVAQAAALPIGTGTVDLALSIFAPRHPLELRRMLRPGGALLVVTPGQRHLGELVERFGLVHVEPGKHDRLHRSLSPLFTCSAQEELEYELVLPHAAIVDLVGMGPSAYHVRDRDIARALAGRDEPVVVTASFVVHVFHTRPASA